MDQSIWTDEDLSQWAAVRAELVNDYDDVPDMSDDQKFIRRVDLINVLYRIEHRYEHGDT